MKCPSCGEHLEPSWDECPACETPTGAPGTCPTCGGSLKSHWKKCPSCKTSLTPSAGAGAITTPGWRLSPFDTDPHHMGIKAPPGPMRSGPFSNPQVLPELLPGERLGKYRIGRVLGRGGFGTVHEAEDTVTGEAVALKVVPTFGSGRRVVPRLSAEYRAQRRIKDREHILEMDAPDLVTLSNVEWVLLRMEKAEKSLRDWLLETRDDVESRLNQGLEYLRQTCRGVSALHEAGIAHLDLKPENLLLVRDDEATEAAKKAALQNGLADPGPKVQLKIADFGLARNLNRLDTINPAFLRDGVGTPCYMAPEQVFGARQKDLGFKADIYALGVILYELLDGDLPFDGSAEEVKRKHKELEPPKICATVPGYLKDIALMCLQKDPERRPDTVKALEQLLIEDPEEERAFSLAMEQNNEKAWEAFLERFPSGSRAKGVRACLVKLVSMRETREKEWSENRQQILAKILEELDLGRLNEAMSNLDMLSTHLGEKASTDKDFKIFKGLVEEAFSAKHRAEGDVRKREAEERRVRELTPPADPKAGENWHVPKYGLEHIYIPPGDFEMGAVPSDMDHDPNEKPRHPTQVTRGFWIGRAPVTVDSYRKFCRVTDRRMPDAPDFNPSWRYGNHPMVKVSWEEAAAYCAWLGGRLPTEAEWEYAVRAGTETKYWWGDEMSDACAWYSENASGSTHPVREKRANPWGLYDTLGHVFEWCADWFQERYYQNSPAESPLCLSKGAARVLRGGSWYFFPWYLRASYRSPGDPSSHDDSYGFRTVIPAKS